MKNNKIILGLDLSLSNSGYAVFEVSDDTIIPVTVGSIPTSHDILLQTRLSIIGKRFLELKDTYKPKAVILESGFYRYIISTQQLYRVQGIASYLFADCEQFLYPPSTVKKYVTGKGNAKKELVKIFVLEKFPDLKIETDDESDAVGLIITYFMKEVKGL